MTDEWGRPKRRRKSEKRQRAAVVSVRMTAEELAAVEANADAAGETISAYMRALALVTPSPVLSMRGYSVWECMAGHRRHEDPELNEGAYLTCRAWIDKAQCLVGEPGECGFQMRRVVRVEPS